MHIDEKIWPSVGASATSGVGSKKDTGYLYKPSESRARINTPCPQPIYRPPNRHQPKKSPSNSVGARVVEWGREGLDGRPRPVPCAHLWENALTPPPPGDHQGPPIDINQSDLTLSSFAALRIWQGERVPPMVSPRHPTQAHSRLSLMPGGRPCGRPTMVAAHLSIYFQM